MYFLDKVVTETRPVRSSRELLDQITFSVFVFFFIEKLSLTKPSRSSHETAQLGIVRGSNLQITVCNSAKKSGEICAKTQHFFTLITLIKCGSIFMMYH